MLRALGFKPKPNPAIFRAKLPAAHTFVDLALPRGIAGSVSIDAIGAKTFVTTIVHGIETGSVAVFTYTNSVGKFRFTTKCIAVKGPQAHFDLPKTIETLQKLEASGAGAQKRTNVRLDTVVPSHWRYAPGGRGSGEFMRASVTDISRTGASLICDRELSKGSQVEVRLSLNTTSQPMTILGEVMRASKIERSGKMSLGLRFLGMTLADDRTIMDFINKRQAERRSRGLA